MFKSFLYFLYNHDEGFVSILRQYLPGHHLIGLEFGNPERPEADNLLGLYAVLSGKGKEAAQQDCASMGWGAFKPMLAEVVVEAIRPVQERYRDLRADDGQIDAVLRNGRLRASEVANETLQRVRDGLGFLPPR